MDVADMLAEAAARYDTQMALAARAALARIGRTAEARPCSHAGIIECFANREEHGSWRHRAANARRRP